MKNLVRNVEVHLNDKHDKIVYASCDCPISESERCHHIGAVLLYIHEHVSKTDVRCSWSVKNKKPHGKTQTVGELYGLEENRTSHEHNITDRKLWLQNMLSQEGYSCPFSWYVCEEPEEEKIYGDSTLIFQSAEFRASTNKRIYLEKECRFSIDEITKIAFRTKEQFKSYKFCILCQYRLTGSNIGFILHAIERGRFPVSFWTRVLGLNSLNGVKSIEWGKQHEEDAVACLRKQLPHEIKKVGIFLHSSGVLGASPDGVTDECVIECKCPYSFRTAATLDECLGKKGYIVEKDNDGTYNVNTNHEYYHQLQSQMLFADKNFGILCLWIPNDFRAFVVERDRTWDSNIDKLLNFYYNTYVP